MSGDVDAVSNASLSTSGAVCMRSVGEISFRAYPAFTCDTCAYSVCSTCFVKCMETQAAKAGTGGAAVASVAAATRNRVQCHVCDTGRLIYDEVPVFPWICEGMFGLEWRRATAKKMVPYDFRATQRFHQIRSLREERAKEKDNIKFFFRYAPVKEGSAAVERGGKGLSHSTRGACVVEGDVLTFTVANKGLATPMVWCGASFVPRSTLPCVAGGNHNSSGSNTGAALPRVSLTPIVRFTCQPSLEGVADTPLTLRCPVGAVDVLGFEALQLFRLDQLVGSNSDDDVDGDDLVIVGAKRRHRGEATASEPPPAPLVTVAIINVMSRGPPSVALHTPQQQAELQRARELRGFPAQATSKWNHADEAFYFAVDSLRNGRNVLVTGFGSKMPFLRMVHNSVEFAGNALHVIEAFGLGARGGGGEAVVEDVTQRIRHLQGLRSREIQRQRNQHLTKCGGGVGGRRPVTDDQKVDLSYFNGDFAREAAARTDEDLLIGRARLLFPVPKTITDESCGVVTINTSKDLPPQPMTIAPGLLAKISADRQRRVMANGGLLHRGFGSALPSGLSEPIGAARQLVVVHCIDLLDAAALAALAQLVNEDGSMVSLLCSVDDPLWLRAPANASAIGTMRFAIARYEGPLLPRVIETMSVDATAWDRAARGRASALPMADTLRRVLTSVPVAFRGILRVMLDLQLEQGDDAMMNVNTIMDFLAERRRMVTTSRMRSIINELASNRLGVYEASTHSLKLLQPALLAKVLEEVGSDGA